MRKVLKTLVNAKSVTFCFILEKESYYTNQEFFGLNGEL
jgi:hypothetical protein